MLSIFYLKRVMINFPGAAPRSSKNAAPGSGGSPSFNSISASPYPSPDMRGCIPVSACQLGQLAQVSFNHSILKFITDIQTLLSQFIWQTRHTDDRCSGSGGDRSHPPLHRLLHPVQKNEGTLAEGKATCRLMVQRNSHLSPQKPKSEEPLLFAFSLPHKLSVNNLYHFYHSWALYSLISKNHLINTHVQYIIQSLFTSFAIT